MNISNQRSVKSCLPQFRFNICKVFSLPHPLSRKPHKISTGFNYSDALGNGGFGIEGVCVGHRLNADRVGAAEGTGPIGMMEDCIWDPLLVPLEGAFWRDVRLPSLEGGGEFVSRSIGGLGWVFKLPSLERGVFQAPLLEGWVDLLFWLPSLEGLGVGLSLGYFRRAWGGFIILSNPQLPSEHSSYSF